MQELSHFNFTPQQLVQLFPIIDKAFTNSKPAELMHNPLQYLAYIMVSANWKTVCGVRAILGEDPFKAVLANPPTGVFDKKSWQFWHKHYHLADTPLPPGYHSESGSFGPRPPKNFPDQYKIGLDGEKLMLDYYGPLLGAMKPDGRESDIYLSAIRSHQEHKTDGYDMRKTVNCFVESISDRATRSLGGPTRAVAHRIPFFSYLFSEQKICYWFDSQTLYDHVQQYIKDYNPELMNVFNEDKHTGRTWYTQGHKVPREYLEPIALAVHDLAMPATIQQVNPLIIWAAKNGQAFQPGQHPKNLPTPARLLTI